MEFTTKVQQLYNACKAIRNSGTGQMCSILSFLQLLFCTKDEKTDLASAILNALTEVNSFGSNIPDSSVGTQPSSGDRFSLFANLCDTRIIIIDNSGKIWAFEPEGCDVRIDGFLNALSMSHRSQLLDGLRIFQERIDKLPLVIKWAREIHFEAIDPLDKTGVLTAIELFCEQDDKRTYGLLVSTVPSSSSTLPEVKHDEDLARAFEISDGSSQDIDIDIVMAITENLEIEQEKEKQRSIESDKNYAESLSFL